MEKAIYKIQDLPIKKIYSGKVRELFKIDENSMLLVTTDRISAFDVILPTPIPEKGKILNGLSLFWFDYLKGSCPSHIITADFNLFPDVLKPYKSILEGRSVIVKITEKIPVECVVRGYLSGSGWKEYIEKGSVGGNKIPPGLKESEKIPQPVFTPSTKEEIGVHDRNICYDDVVKMVGEKTAIFLKETSLKVYQKALQYADKRGIIIADTKFEFGFDDGNIILIDEILTPDSSRFWEKKTYRAGKSQDSLDKQYVRDYLESISWNKKEPAPALPQDIVEKTREKYLQIYKILTGYAY